MALTRQHGLGPTRARVLTLLQGSVEPVSVVQVATELDMHKNSARFHLDGLVEAGYADRVVATPHAPGRPPLVYAATSTSPTMSNIHLLELIGVLLDEVQSRGAEAEADCLQAGRRWGARMAEPDTSAERVPEELAEHLTQRGFGVQRDADEQPQPHAGENKLGPGMEDVASGQADHLPDPVSAVTTLMALSAFSSFSL